MIEVVFSLSFLLNSFQSGTIIICCSVLPFLLADASLGTLDRIRPLLLVLAIFAGLAFGFLLPEFIFDWFNAVIYFSLIILVFSLVMGAQFEDVLRSLKNIRFFTIAWFLNFVVIPFVAFGLALIFLGPFPAIFVGFILYSIAPCTRKCTIGVGLASDESDTSSHPYSCLPFSFRRTHRPLPNIFLDRDLLGFHHSSVRFGWNTEMVDEKGQIGGMEG
jgi:hypothetical protein